MTIKKMGLLLACLFCLQISINAQSKSEKKVAEAVQKLTDAMVSGNKEDLENIVMEDLSYGHSGGHIDDKKEFVTKLAPGGGSDFVTIDLTEQTIKITGKTAVVRHILTAKTNDGGKPADVHLRVLLVFIKVHGNWKLLARQAVKIV
jgi:ketosteroid isomerase-like protein